MLTDSQVAAIERLNRPVGRIKLHGLGKLVEQILVLQGKEEIKIPEDGYRSVYTPEMLDVPMKKFLAPKYFRPDKRRLTSAVGQVRRRLKGMGTVKPLDLELAFELLLSGKENKSAGLPTMGRKQDDHEALVRARSCWNGKCPPPTSTLKLIDRDPYGEGLQPTLARARWWISIST